MDYEKISLKLLTRILNYPQEYRKVLERNFDPVKLHLRWAPAGIFIMQYFLRHTAMPNYRAIKEKYPQFEKIKATHPATHYWDEIIAHKKIAGLQYIKGLLNEGTLTKETVDEAIDGIMVDLYKLKGKFDTDSQIPENIAELYKKVMNTHNQKQTGELKGLPIPFEIMRASLGSWFPGKLIITMARPGVGKTWFVCINAVAAVKENFKVLITSMEMTKEEIGRRMVALFTGINFSRLSKGSEFSTKEKDKLTEFEKSILDKYADNLIIVGPGTITKPELLEPYIRLYEPDLVIVDSFYIQKDVPGRDSKEKTDYLLHAYRNLTSQSNICMMLTSQLNRDAVKDRSRSNSGANVAFTDHINYLADVTIMMRQDEHQKKGKQIDITQVKVRDGISNVVGRYNWDFERMNFECAEVVFEAEDNIFEDNF